MDSENPSPQEQAAERFAREQRFQEIAEEVDRIRDALGRPVDPSIRETLIALKAQGLDTSQSCEGHDDESSALPWVDVASPEPEGWEESEEKKNEWRRANEALAEKLRALVDEWYGDRAKQGEVIPDDNRLALQPHGIYGAVRLESPAQERISKLGSEDRAREAAVHRAEMRRFSEYLTQRFLGVH